MQGLPQNGFRSSNIYDLIEGKWSYNDRVRFCRTVRKSATAVEAAHALGLSLTTVISVARVLQLRLGNGDDRHDWNRHQTAKDALVDGSDLMDRIEGRKPLVARVANMRKAEQLQRFGKFISQAEAARKMQEKCRGAAVDRQADLAAAARRRIKVEAQAAIIAARERREQAKAERQAKTSRADVVAIADIIRLGEEFFGIHASEIAGAQRFKDIVNARFAVIHAARELTGKSTTLIGRQLGGRDHSTIVYALAKPREPYEPFISYCREALA